MTFAAADWPGVAAVASVIASLVLGALTFARGRKADDALSMSTMTKTNLETQQHIIDQLQEEVETERSLRRETETELRDVRDQLREVRHENANLKIEVDSAKRIVVELERQIAELTKRLEDLGA